MAVEPKKRRVTLPPLLKPRGERERERADTAEGVSHGVDPRKSVERFAKVFLDLWNSFEAHLEQKQPSIKQLPLYYIYRKLRKLRMSGYAGILPEITMGSGQLLPVWSSDFMFILQGAVSL